MLHTADANTSTFTAGLSAARSDAPVLKIEANARPVRVSTLGESALREGKPEMLAMSGTPTLGDDAPQARGSDMAVVALGLIGAWLVLVGTALLARHLRMVRLEQTTL